MVRRRARLLAVVTGLAVAATATGGTIALSDGSAPGTARLSLSCLPFSAPKTVAALNAQIAHYRSVPGFVGADVGADVTLSDGRGLWVFGDTLRPARSAGPLIVRNSMLMFSPGCATVVTPSDHGAVVPDRTDGVGYWPMDLGVVHESGFDLVGVSLQRVRSTGKGAFDFEILGPAIALFRIAPGAAPQLVRVEDLGPDDPDTERPMWGSAVETVGSTAYIYGTAQPNDHSSFGWSLRVARAPITAVTDPTRWRYWDGARWQRDEARAAVLIPAIGGVSEVLSVFTRDGSWYAVSKRDESLGTDLVIWKAPAPTGPFLASRPLAKIPSNDGLLRYMPLAHPDLLPSKGSIVVSYSRNTADLNRLLKDPDLYRPRFLQVPLP
jgi:hypothetical protein